MLPSFARVFQISFLIFISISVLYTTHQFSYFVLAKLWLGSAPVLSFFHPGGAGFGYRPTTASYDKGGGRPGTWAHLDLETHSLFEKGPYLVINRDDKPVVTSRAGIASVSTSGEFSVHGSLGRVWFQVDSSGISSLLEQNLGPPFAAAIKNATNDPLSETDHSFIRQETLLSKAFSQAFHPTRVIPYFYRATGKVDINDVTITTLVTSNRFKVLKQLAERYRGPISVTIHIPFPSQTTLRDLRPNSPSLSALRELHELYHSTPHFSTYVDVHLALSPFSRKVAYPSYSSSAYGGGQFDTGYRSTNEGDSDGEGGRQFNVWRNVARLFSRTEFVMMLDVDFAVCTDWRSAVRRALRGVDLVSNDITSASTASVDTPIATNNLEEDGKETAYPPKTGVMKIVDVVPMLREGTAVLVVPAFEYITQEDGEDQGTFPQDKESLLRLTNVSPPLVTSFHASWTPGHNSTDYPKYYSTPSSGEGIYKVETYQSAYEPYVITSKHVPWCDERFTGYGANKAACLFEMYLSGVSFYVLSDHFLIHQSHKYEEVARREERKYNRKLYTDFKEEACLRYLYRFYHRNSLDTPQALNVKNECRKIKSVVRVASELWGIAL